MFFFLQLQAYKNQITYHVKENSPSLTSSIFVNEKEFFFTLLLDGIEILFGFNSI